TTASLLAVAAGVATGGLCGLVNGLVITGLRVTPFVATLGMLSVARGVAYWWTNKLTLTIKGPTPGWVKAVSYGTPKTGLFDPGVWSVLVLAVVVAVLLRRTVLGRYCYAIGSSEATARLCGVPVGRSKVVLYAVAGMLTGWAGVLLFAHTGTGNPATAGNLEL